MAAPRVTIPVGTRFGKLTVLGEGPLLGSRRVRSLECRCDCGTITSPSLQNLRRENGTRSCGCDKEMVLKRQQETGRTHGMRQSRVYGIWHGMKQRCLNPNAKEYKWYGARGIQVCETWRNSFEAFYADIGDPPSDQHSIERIDVNGDYEPRNCCWAEQAEQASNMRTNINLTHKGQTMNLSQWARQLDIPRATLMYRYHHGWSTNEILFGRV